MQINTLIHRQLKYGYYSVTDYYINIQLTNNIDKVWYIVVVLPSTFT